MSEAIGITGLKKVYGETRALDGVDLVVPEGSVFGFLGPNGAGKTTTLRILTGMARPTSGTARILGQDVVTAGNNVRALIGFLPDVPGFYEWMNAEELLRFAGHLFGLPGKTLDERVAVLLELAGLAGVKTRIGGYSRGMKQRLGIAQALINAPHLLLLDEPTSALDPMGRKDVLDMIASLKERTTVFFSTHILADVERVCDTVAILNKGIVVTQAGIDELRRRGAAHRITVEVESGVEELREAIARKSWVKEFEQDGRALHVSVSDLTAAEKDLPAVVAEKGLAMRRFEIGEMSLEEVFVELVEGGWP